MPSTKTISKGIRITNEAALYFDGKPLNRMIEGLIPLLESGELVYDGENLKISPKSGVHTDSVDGIFGEFEEMASCCGMTTEEMIDGLFSMLEEGEIVIENGRLMPSMPEWALEFESTCHEKGLETEKVAEKAISALKRGGF